MLKLNAPLVANCAEFIKKEEGLRLKPYICPGGVKTVGYGHALKPTDSVKEITEEAAFVILKDDIGIALDAIDFDVMVNLNNNQIAALCSFIYNVGVSAFKKSTLLKKLNAGASLGDVAAEFHKWNKVGTVVLTGLTNRRKKEADLFLTPVPSETLATSALSVSTIKTNAKNKHWFIELLMKFLDLRKKA
jgi:lysozyme